jgi:ABC-type transport system involved in multi-copper enzyme maturation permease subunit
MTSPRTVAAFWSASFKESIRARWLIVFTVVYFLVLVNIPFYVGSISYPFLPLLTLPLGALSIVDEKESGTLQYLLCTRMTRLEFLTGRFLGMLTATSVVVLSGFVLAGLVVLNINASVLQELGLEAGIALLLNLIMLSLAITISTLSKRKVTALSVAIFAWFLFFILSDFGESFGLVAILPNGTFAEVLAALVNPIETSALVSEMSVNAYGPQLGPTIEILKTYFGGPSVGLHTALMSMELSLLVWLVVTVTAMFFVFRRAELV